MEIAGRTLCSVILNKRETFSTSGSALEFRIAHRREHAPNVVQSCEKIDNYPFEFSIIDHNIFNKLK